MKNNEGQTLDEIIISKICESSTLSSTKFTQACQIGIVFFGARENVYSPEKGITNVPPYYPHRENIRSMYSESLASINVLREIEVQKAEEMGIIDRISNQVRAQWTMEMLAKIIREMESKKLINHDMKIRADNAFELSEGMLRRPFDK